MLATPAVSQADQGRQRAAGHPAPTVAAGVSPATHLRRRDREAAWPPAEARSSEERGAPVRCAAPAQCYCAWGETEAVTAPAGALCCPPDRPGALRGASGRCTSAVSRCVGATGGRPRLQRGPRPKVSLCPERSVDLRRLLRSLIIQKKKTGLTRLRNAQRPRKKGATRGKKGQKVWQSAGGVRTRAWPVSHGLLPKSLLARYSDPYGTFEMP
jgi:hypothetical protein